MTEKGVNLPLKRQPQQKSPVFVCCWNVLVASITTSMDPDQTAPSLDPWFALLYLN